MADKLKSRGFVQEWMKSAELIQADMIKRLGYSKAKAFAVWHGDQRLNEDILEEIAALVNARPYEILLHPDQAYRLRRLEAVVADAIRPVAEPEPVSTPARLDRKVG